MNLIVDIVLILVVVIVLEGLLEYTFKHLRISNAYKMYCYVIVGMIPSIIIYGKNSSMIVLLMLLLLGGHVIMEFLHYPLVQVLKEKHCHVQIKLMRAHCIYNLICQLVILMIYTILK